MALIAYIDEGMDRERNTCYEASIVDEVTNSEIEFMGSYYDRADLERDIRQKYGEDIEIENS